MDDDNNNKIWNPEILQGIACGHAVVSLDNRMGSGVVMCVMACGKVYIVFAIGFHEIKFPQLYPILWFANVLVVVAWIRWIV